MKVLICTVALVSLALLTSCANDNSCEGPDANFAGAPAGACGNSDRGNYALPPCIIHENSVESDPRLLNPERTNLRSELEKHMATRMVDELNLARTQPKFYAKLIEQNLDRYDGNILNHYTGSRLQTSEGRAAAEEAIAFLRTQEPLGCLEYSEDLSLPARDHAMDQGQTGQTGHGGSDGSQPGERVKRYGVFNIVGENISYGPSYAREVVIGLIVDDGVADRGHRTNIYNPDFETVGVYCGTHNSVYDWVCVHNYAKNFEPKQGNPVLTSL